VISLNRENSATKIPKIILGEANTTIDHVIEQKSNAYAIKTSVKKRSVHSSVKKVDSKKLLHSQDV
jgi:hypothetical protein